MNEFDSDIRYDSVNAELHCRVQPYPNLTAQDLDEYE